MTVMDFHNRILHLKEYLQMMFLISCKTLIKSCQKLDTFLLNKPCLEMNEIDNVTDKSCFSNSMF